MICKICRSEKCKVIYKGNLRKGCFGNKTQEIIPMYLCENCSCIWHENINEDLEKYYGTETYRQDMGEKFAEDYYRYHDREVIDKLNYTGTDIFRNKIVADVGCAGGSFLDFVKGVSKKTLAFEPATMYQESLKSNGHVTFSYMSDALEEYRNSIDIITSFDVIEHVESPIDFMKEQRQLLNKTGIVINGTPTSAVIMRTALGREYEEFLYTYQHPWVFSEEAIKLIAKQAGFNKIKVEYKQRYGLGNLLSWHSHHKPMGHVSYDYISDIVDEVWKRDLENKKVSDYMVLYAEV